MADLLADLLSLADAYAEAAGLSLSTVSGRVLHGGDRLRDLRSGKADIGVRRLETALRWFSDNWPADAAWPAGVARPHPTPAEAAS